MRKLFLVTLICLFSTSAFAAPFLVCDPQEGVAKYNVYRNGELVFGEILAQPDGSLRVDVSTFPGAAEWTATAVNIWGESAPSDPYLSPAVLNTPGGLRLVP